MYTLRLTRALLAHFDADDSDESAADVAPTTRLGDWYVMPLEVDARHLLLCTSERSLLSVVMPADRLGELPEHLVTALVGVLHRLGVPREATVAEVDAMTSGGVGPIRNRSTLGSMRGLAARVEAFLAGTRGDVDAAALFTMLGEYRSRQLGGRTASERAIELLRVAPASTGAAPQRPRKRR